MTYKADHAFAKIAIIKMIVIFAFVLVKVSWAFDPAHVHKALNGPECVGCDLVGSDLQWQDLSNKDLSGANLSLANLKGANLNGTILSGANLTRATWVDGFTCRDGSIGYCLR